MRVWAYAAAVGVAGAASGGIIGFLDVSTGSHDVPVGTEYRYAVARGDAVLTLSGGLVLSGFEIEASARGSLPSAPDLFGSVLATDNAQVIFDSGRVGFPVVGAGRSNVWVGRDAEFLVAHAREQSVVTLERDPDDPFVEVECFEQGTMIVRGGRFLGTDARESSTLYVTGGEIFGDLNSFETSRVELSGGVVHGWAEAWGSSEFEISDGYVDDVAESNGDSAFLLSGGSVQAVWPRSSKAFVMTGGEVRGDIISGSSFIAHGGVIAGDVGGGTFGDNSFTRFHVRSASYDHDANPDTAHAAIAFDDEGVAVIEQGDPRLAVIDQGGSIRVEMLDVRVVWDDGTDASFDFYAEAPLSGWDGRLEFVRSTIVGDLNEDGGIDVLDLALFLTAFGAEGGPADFNGDGLVDVLDLVRFLQAWENER